MGLQPEHTRSCVDEHGSVSYSVPLHAAVHVRGCVVVVPEGTAGQKTFEPSQPVVTQRVSSEAVHASRTSPASHAIEEQSDVAVLSVPLLTAGHHIPDNSQPDWTHVGEVELPLQVTRYEPASHAMGLQPVLLPSVLLPSVLLPSVLLPLILLRAPTPRLGSRSTATFPVILS